MYTNPGYDPAAEQATGTDTTSVPQAVRAQTELRARILRGEFAPGSRVTELALVDLLRMSRTPIRSALIRLQDEGLLQALPGGGFSVRTFSAAEVHDAIELRGTLEGLAARMAAERGASQGLLDQAAHHLDCIDQALQPDPTQPLQLSEQAFLAYAEHNAAWHRLIVAMAASSIVERQIDRALQLPFASPNAFVIPASVAHGAATPAPAITTPSWTHLLIAQDQHRAVLQAIAQREGSRAEALMREHARHARRNLPQGG